MKITVNREHIEKVAKELGFKVEFDSPTPGVRMPDGSIRPFTEVAAKALEEIGIHLPKGEEE